MDLERDARGRGIWILMKSETRRKRDAEATLLKTSVARSGEKAFKDPI